ncbi:MAG: hypothetical protein ACOCXG_04420 [Nanoarchaeota archaeon]
MTLRSIFFNPPRFVKDSGCYKIEEGVNYISNLNEYLPFGCQRGFLPRMEGIVLSDNEQYYFLPNSPDVTRIKAILDPK